MGKPRDLIQPAALLQHIAVYPAASVAVTVGDQKISVHLLFAVAVPHALYGAGHELSVVGVKPAVRRAVRLRRRDEMGQHPASVDAFPVKRVVGHPVVLVPADLRRHKHVDARFFQNLRQRPGIAEHIRQPQKFHVLAEFFLNKPAAEQNLTGQRFPAR